MKKPIIINVSKRMGIGNRLLTGIGTAMLWLFWLSLWQPVIQQSQTLVANSRHSAHPLIYVLQGVNSLAPISLTHAFFALTGTASLLLLWTFMPGKARTYHHRVEVTGDYARYFNLLEQSIINGRQSQVCTVYHDEAGQITHIAPHTAFSPVALTPAPSAPE